MSSHPSGGAAAGAVPILAYHTIADDSRPEIAPFAVRPAAFARHLDLIVGGGHTALTVSDYVAFVLLGVALPPRPVVITFDDGFEDNLSVAAPLLAERGLPATVFVSTGLLPGCPGGPSGRTFGPMIPWARLRELEAADVEIGAHSRTHPQLDVLRRSEASLEIARSKADLEAALGHPVSSFAYPHGYASAWLQDEVRRLGFLSACGVRHAFSYPGDNRWLLARLVVGATTTDARLDGWLHLSGARPAPRREHVRTKAWRGVRRARVSL